LQDFAARDWRFTEQKELPADWKLRVSTYLKAWACGLNPNCLIEMAEMLVKAGYKTEAKTALEVVLLFPTYAHKFFGGSEGSGALADGIVNQARESFKHSSGSRWTHSWSELATQTSLLPVVRRPTSLYTPLPICRSHQQRYPAAVAGSFVQI
jgi:hypothetical protein